MSWESRAAIFLKAADLLAGPYRQVLNAAMKQAVADGVNVGYDNCASSFQTATQSLPRIWVRGFSRSAT